MKGKENHDVATSDAQKVAILKRCFGSRSIDRIALEFGVTPSVVKTVFKEHVDRLGAKKRYPSGTVTEREPNG